MQSTGSLGGLWGTGTLEPAQPELGSRCCGVRLSWGDLMLSPLVPGQTGML